MRRRLWRRLVTILVVALIVFLVGGCELTHFLILAFAPEPFRTLPVKWSRVSVDYHVVVTYAGQPQRATILLPAPLLDGHEIPAITREMAERIPDVTVAVNERGTFYKLTEKSVDPRDFAIVAYIDVRINERPTRWLFWDNHLVERFDLSGQVGPDGHRGYWVYVDSDVPVTNVDVHAYLLTAYAVYDVQTLDSPEVEIEDPKNGWTWVKGEEGP